MNSGYEAVGPDNATLTPVDLGKQASSEARNAAVHMAGGTVASHEA